MERWLRVDEARALFGWGVVTLAALAAVGCGGPETRAIAVEEVNGSLSLVVGTFDRTCGEAHSIILECGRWELLVNLDPEAQQGEQPLVSEFTWAENLVSDGDYDGTECLVQGGTFEQGTVEITARESDVVSFTVSGTAVGKFDADGSYDASVCP